MKSFNETTCGISKALFTSFEKKGRNKWKG
jgi:hypothetical protein